MQHQADAAALPQNHARQDAEIIQLEAAQDHFFEREVFYRDLLNALPAAVYTTDADGKITFFNNACVEFAGREPALGEEWCVTWRLYNLDGTPLPHDECPMAVALKEGRPIRGAEAIAERPDGSRITFTPYPTPLFDAAGEMVGAVNMLVDISQRKLAEQQQTLLANEVNHRANNLLTVVQSIIRLTKSDDLAGYKETIDGRIQALARAHTLLAKSRWAEADLQLLVSEEMAPYMGEEARAWIGGRPLALKPAAAQCLAMIIHELATNAAKYGALSTGEGRVHIDWQQKRGELILRWREEGGPEVKTPSAYGVGATVITRSAAQLNAIVTQTWRPEGLEFEFRGPAEGIVQHLEAEDLS